MKTVLSIPLQMIEQQTVKLPKGSTILTAKRVSPIQGTNVVLVARGDDSKETENRVIQIYEIGHEVNEEELVYIGTVEVFTPGSKLLVLFENK